jgi:hypothetical protein
MNISCTFDGINLKIDILFNLTYPLLKYMSKWEVYHLAMTNLGSNGAPTGIDD